MKRPASPAENGAGAAGCPPREFPLRITIPSFSSLRPVLLAGFLLALLFAGFPPRSGAEELSGRLVGMGIKGFWNFSHYDLSVPYPEVVVENVHLGDSLMSLGYRLRNQD